MARRKRGEPPKYRLFKPRGLAVVTIDGRAHYLGKYGSPESHEEYARLIAEWRQRNDSPEQPARVPSSLTVLELTVAYWKQHASTYYTDGRRGSVRACLKQLNAVYGSTPAAEFGPLKLQAFRQQLVDRGLKRSYVNGQVITLKLMFRWAVSQELVGEPVWRALESVRGLRAGKTAAVEPEGVAPVAESVVRATIEHAPPAVAAMIELQLLTGARPGEITALRPRDVTFQTDGVWCYRPESHKTQHHGKQRRIFIGPRGQDVLRPFLLRDADAHCFSPRESEERRRSEVAAEREREGLPRRPKPRKRNPRRPPRDRYDKNSYCRAVKRACEIAFGMPERLRCISSKATAEERARLNAEAAAWRKRHCWTPNQLRHARATFLRRRYGDIEAAKVVLGHSKTNTTEIYAERDFAKAADIMREIG